MTASGYRVHTEKHYCTVCEKETIHYERDGSLFCIEHQGNYYKDKDGDWVEKRVDVKS